MKNSLGNVLMRVVMIFVLAISSVLFFQSVVNATEQESDIEGFVTRFYQECLGREPDTDGLDHWVDALNSGDMSGADLAWSFIYSDEFQGKNTTDDEYLEVLYQAFFNREQDEGGYNHWLSLLAEGTDRSTVLEGFISSQEFITLCDKYGIMTDNSIASDEDQVYNEVKGFAYEEISGKTYAIIESQYNNCTYDISFSNDHQFFVDDESDTYNYNIVNGSLVTTDQYGRTITLTPLERKDSVITVNFSATGSHFEEESGWGNIDFSNLNNSATALKDWFITNGFWPNSTITADGRVTNTEASFDGRWWIENNVFIFDYPEEGGCVDTKAYKLINNRLMFATDADYTYTFTMSPKN